MELPNFQNFDTTTKKNIQEFGPTYSRSGAPLLILLFTVYDIKGKNSDEIYFRLLFRNEFWLYGYFIFFQNIDFKTAVVAFLKFSSFDFIWKINPIANSDQMSWIR